MLVLIIGEVGSGKTLFMVLMALSTVNKTILANFNIKHPNFKLLQFDDFLNIEKDTDVYIDEAYTWLESRRGMKSSNVYISQIKEQRRKTDSTWYITEQHATMIDKRFEQYPNVLVQCKTRYPIGRSIDDFSFKITYEKPYSVTYKKLLYQDAIKYFSSFNTNEIVRPENKDLIEYHIISNNPEKYFKKVKELAKILLKDKTLKKYTHDSVEMACLKHNILLKYKKHIYAYLKHQFNLKNINKKAKE